MNVEFDKEFLWGGALSNVQAEGASLEHGKGLNVYDTLIVDKESGQKEVNSSDPASNHYYQFEEDIQLMKEMSFKAYRFSIVWSRIHPNGNEREPNQAGLDYYNKMIDLLLEAGIEPVVSLVHFDMPDYLAKKYNGFYSKEVIDFYENHVTKVVNYFKDKVTYWITYNEINTAPFGNHARLVAGAVKPENITNHEFYHQIVKNTQLAHARAVLTIRKISPTAKISGMINYGEVHPKTSKPNDVLAASIINRYHTYLAFDIMTDGEYPNYYKNFLTNRGITINFEELKDIKSASDELDFLSLSYYQTRVISSPEIEDLLKFENEVIFNSETEVSEYLLANEWGWAISPKGFRLSLETIYDRYKKPLFIVENGVGLVDEIGADGEVDDTPRINYYREHLRNMSDAIKFSGVEVIGYLAWAPIDFLSSHKEMRKRYGFVYIGESLGKTKKLLRLPKKSFYWYKSVIESNGEIINE